VRDRQRFCAGLGISWVHSAIRNASKIPLEKQSINWPYSLQHGFWICQLTCRVAKVPGYAVAIRYPGASFCVLQNQGRTSGQ